MASLANLLALRRDPRIARIPPYLSILFVTVGVIWLFLLPLNEYSRNTYVSENALLPGQVHTYFGGSEHNIFRAYRHETASLEGATREERVSRLKDVFRTAGLKVSSQKYQYQSNGNITLGENVYAVLQGPRADATEAVVLIAAWRNMDSAINYSGVALVLTLARYFKRWSLWSKDIIFLVTEDSVSGSQAWVDAYHDAHDPTSVDSLQLKSGALQGAVAVDYPAGTWGHRFDKLHIIYDGTNGQLPNLDLFNTAVSIASGQMGIGCTLQRMWDHNDSYRERLQTMLRGMLNQGIGHATGPHSAFIAYHVDAITLQTVGDGWQDEMSLGRTLEGIFRSLNNLLEHLHQSFFFYLLMQANRFVSIGTYLPSAMLVAASFTIMSIAMWLKSGAARTPTGIAATTKMVTDNSKEKAVNASQPSSSSILEDKSKKTEEMTLISHGDAVAAVPTVSLKVVERFMFLPLLLTAASHFLGLIPLYLFNTIDASILEKTFQGFAIVAVHSPFVIAASLPALLGRKPRQQEYLLLLCFAYLLLGMFLSALATLNFSLALIVGLLSTPMIFVRPSEDSKHGANAPSLLSKSMVAATTLVLALLAPPNVIWAASTLVPGGLTEILRVAGFGWSVWGLWTQVVVWLVWWPAWLAVSVVAASSLM